MLLGLMLDVLYREDHTNILAHLEGTLCKVEFQVSKTVLSKSFKELLRESSARPCDFHALLESMDSQVLEEVSEVTFVRVVWSLPSLDV